MDRLKSSSMLSSLSDQRRSSTPASENNAQHGNPRPPSSKPLSFHLSFVSLCFMVLIVSLDATSLAVAIPAIAKELQGTTLESFWASISFSLAVVVTQPIYTSTSDILGRMLPLYASMLLFAIGCIVFATAQSMMAVILGRTLQGLGGGGLDVLEEMIVADMTALKDRSRYLGILSVPMATGTILGPVMGALLSEHVTWRWIGWVHLPLIGVALILAVAFLRLKPLDQSFRSKLKQLDWGGMFLYTVGSISLTAPLSWAGVLYPWSSWKTITPIGVGAVALLAFAFYESRQTPSKRMFPYHIFDTASAKVTLLGGFIHGTVLYGVVLYLPLFLQACYLETPLRSAVLLLPASCLLVVSSGASAFVVEYTRHYRWVIWLGWIATGLGVGLWAILKQSSPLAELVVLQILAGAGLGILFTIPTIALQASVKNVDDQGLAVGSLVSFRLFGALIGMVLGSALFGNIFAAYLASSDSVRQSLPKFTDVHEAISFIPSLRTLDLPASTMSLVIEAYRKPIEAIWITMGSLTCLGFIMSLFTREESLEKEHLGRQHYEMT